MLRYFFAFLTMLMVWYPGIVDAVEFTDKQKDTYPCLKKVQLPTSAKVAKAGEVPEKYRSWVSTMGGVLVGEWKGTKIGDFCQVVLIENVGENGFAQVWYTSSPNGMFQVFNRHLASIKDSGGQQVLEFNLQQAGVSISYTLKNGDRRADSLYLPSQAKGYVQVIE